MLLLAKRKSLGIGIGKKSVSRFPFSRLAPLLGLEGPSPILSPPSPQVALARSKCNENAPNAEIPRCKLEGLLQHATGLTRVGEQLCSIPEVYQQECKNSNNHTDAHIPTRPLLDVVELLDHFAFYTQNVGKYSLLPSNDTTLAKLAGFQKEQCRVKRYADLLAKFLGCDRVHVTEGHRELPAESALACALQI
ncbi:hypothetical protein G7Y89_g13131 [Cudoniella acicularis]|uniref:Uncharacterized protein n=1 Tax=Cudoniella acicularis TaxID=354080 RepID=A0A8H4R7G8_9HELO|nr:hypothetical protein G7Y89_g13131 [Cudoniella acicularis]